MVPVKSSRNSHQKAERLSDEKLLKLLKKGRVAYLAHDFSKSLECFIPVWMSQGKNASPEVLSVVADLFVKTGRRTEALDLLIEFVDTHGETVDICASAAMLASNMGMYEIALKLNDKAIELDIQDPIHHVNRADSLLKLERFDDAINYLQEVIPLFTAEPGLWNVLGSSVKLRDGLTASRPFFEEALRLEPKSPKYLSNLASACTEVDEIVDLYEQALVLAPDFSEAQVGISAYYFYQGQMDKAWKAFEYRKAADRHEALNQSLTLTHRIPAWNGEDLQGKSILVTAEQGVGDEIFFGAAIASLYEQVDSMKALHIGVDARLVPQIARSFPKANVVRHNTVRRFGQNVRSFPDIELQISARSLEVDYSISIVDLAATYWKESSSLPARPEGYFAIDEERAAEFRARLNSVGAGPFVGVSWRSGNLAASRLGGYMDAVDLINALKTEGVTFVNVQYGDTAEERALIEKETGICLVDWDDLDLKDDFEGVAALMSVLDHVVCPTSAPAWIAAAAGTRTTVFTRLSTMYAFGHDQTCGIYPHVGFIYEPLEGDWSQTKRELKQEILSIAGKAEASDDGETS